MPNLVGLWRPSAAEAEVSATLQRQLAGVQAGFHRYRTHRMGRSHWAAALLDHGLLENGVQPGCSGDGRWQVLLDGDVFNLGELAARHRVPVRHANPGAAQQCAALIGARGLEVVREFNGAFVLVVWDEHDEQLHLVTDRHGARPLFYHEHQGSVAFASELKGIVAAGRHNGAMDPVAVCEQLVYGVHFRGRTWLDGCRRLQPASILTLSCHKLGCDKPGSDKPGRDGLSSRCYWRYQYKYPARPLDQETYAACFAVLLDRAVERCMRGSKRIGIFLSGGYDSRSIAASLRAHHLPMPAFTFGELHSRDMQIAPALAQRLGLTHFPLPPVKPYLYPNAAAIVWRTEGLLPFPNATSVQFHDVMTQHVDIFLAGFLGEFSGSHTWPALLLARDRKTAIEAIYQRFVAPRAARARAVMRPEVFARSFEEMRERFFRSFDDVPNEHPMDIADAWNLTCLRPGGSFQAPAVDRHRLEMRAPHLDNDLVDFLVTIPPLARLEQRVYKRMIANAFPAIRDIPCANSMRPIEPRFWLEYPKMMARFAGRKLSGPVRRWLGREDRLGRELNDLDADIRAETELDTKVLGPLLAGQWLDERIFSLPAIAALGEAHFSGNADHGVVLSHLMSIGLAARMLVRGEAGDVPALYREPAPGSGEQQLA